MSARNILTLVLVAIVAVQANSFPYTAKGGQFEQEPVQAQPQLVQSTPSEQLVSTKSTQQTSTTMAQVGAASAKQLYGAPAQVASAPTSVQASVEAVPAVPVRSQALYQQSAQVHSSKGGYQTVYQPEQRLESAPLKQTVSQAPAAEQVSLAASSKGQSFVQQPAQVYGSKGSPQAFYQQERLPAQQLEAAPLKGAQVHRTKSQWTVPTRKGVHVAQQAPTKGYNYRQRQRVRAPLKGAQLQQTAVRPVMGQTPLKV